MEKIEEKDYNIPKFIYYLDEGHLDNFKKEDNTNCSYDIIIICRYLLFLSKNLGKDNFDTYCSSIYSYDIPIFQEYHQNEKIIAFNGYYNGCYLVSSIELTWLKDKQLEIKYPFSKCI